MSSSSTPSIAQVEVLQVFPSVCQTLGLLRAARHATPFKSQQQRTHIIFWHQQNLSLGQRPSADCSSILLSTSPSSAPCSSPVQGFAPSNSPHQVAVRTSRSPHCGSPMLSPLDYVARCDRLHCDHCGGRLPTTQCRVRATKHTDLYGSAPASAVPNFLHTRKLDKEGSCSLSTPARTWTVRLHSAMLVPVTNTCTPLRFWNTVQGCSLQVLRHLDVVPRVVQVLVECVPEVCAHRHLPQDLGCGQPPPPEASDSVAGLEWKSPFLDLFAAR